jgi:hypothetical protein
MWDSQHLTTSYASTAYYRDSLKYNGPFLHLLQPLLASLYMLHNLSVGDKRDIHADEHTVNQITPRSKAVLEKPIDIKLIMKVSVLYYFIYL